MRRRALSGGLAITGSRLGTQLVRVAITAVLARVLTPEDYGLVSVVLAVTGFGLVLQDLGLSASTIQRESVSAEQVSVLFWLNLALGLAIAIAGICVAPLIATFMSAPEAEHIAMALFAGMVIPTMSAQHRALLQRQMRFREQATIAMVAALVGGICAVAAALRGAGPWALVAFTLVSDSVTLVMSWRASGFIPRAFRWDSASVAMVRFGGGFLMFRILGYLAQNLHVVLIAPTAGVAQAGLFSRAHSTAGLLLGYTNEPAGKIANAALPRRVSDPQQFARTYSSFLSVVMLVAAPTAAFTWLAGSDMVRILLGPGWDTAGTLLSVLAVGMAVQPALNTTGWIYLAQGKVGSMVLWGIFGWGVMIGAAVIGVRWGAQGIAWGWSAALHALLPPCLIAAYRGTRISVTESFAVILKPLGAAALAVVLTIPLHEAARAWAALPRLLACAALFGVGYLALAWWAFGQRQMISTILHMLRSRTQSMTA